VFSIVVHAEDEGTAVFVQEEQFAMARQASEVAPVRMMLTAVYLLMYPLLLLWLSGDWRWVEGWIFGIWFIALCAGTILYLRLKDPALLAERYRKPGTGGEEAWDRYFVYAIVTLFLAWFVMMPLDAKRFHWTAEFPFWLKSAGAFLLLISSCSARFLTIPFSRRWSESRPGASSGSFRQGCTDSCGIRCIWARCACSSARRCF
jgi:hypothetical protein